MHVGGRPEHATLTKREHEICEAMGPDLKKRWLIFVGIDVISDCLTEINVTSPTGIREVKRFGGEEVNCNFLRSWFPWIFVPCSSTVLAASGFFVIAAPLFKEKCRIIFSALRFYLIDFLSRNTPLAACPNLTCRRAGICHHLAQNGKCLKDCFKSCDDQRLALAIKLEKIAIQFGAPPYDPNEPPMTEPMTEDERSEVKIDLRKALDTLKAENPEIYR